MTTYTVKIHAFEDDARVKGNAMASGDPEIDSQCELEILARLRSGDVWAWASVRVTCTCDECGASGEDYLGCCSYADQTAFEADGYYQDMVTMAHGDMLSHCSCRAPVGTDTGRTVDA